MWRNWKAVLLLTASLFGSFFITLWLTAPPDLPPVVQVDTLATIAASNNNDVLQQLAAAGFHPDKAIIGKIDQFAKAADGSLRIYDSPLARIGVAGVISLKRRFWGTPSPWRSA